MQESMLQLLISMTNNRALNIVGSDSIERRGVVNAIQVEDGSRTGFNINLNQFSPVAEQVTIYVKRPVGSGLTVMDPIRPMQG